jgi:PTH2 family peptidyl-tRNA hydrolase
LVELYTKAKQAGLICSLIVDAGLTEFGGVPTKTCCAIGPAWAEDVDKITGELKLL